MKQTERKIANTEFFKKLQASNVWVVNPDSENPLKKRIGFINSHSVTYLNAAPGPHEQDGICISFAVDDILSVGSECGALYIDFYSCVDAVKINETTFDIQASFDGCEPLFEGAEGVLRISLVNLTI